jgi:uroporphyrin-III C-methyltransferase/precorrin-2 dehydrogenase/sirohydrochlorin ferrochelatase
MSELSSLPLFHRIAGQRVLVLGEGDAAEAKRRLVERAGGIVEIDEQRAVDEGVRLAFVAFADAKACEVAAINLRCAGLLVNVVDRPDLCDFTTPSILDRHPVLVAIGTAGASAGLAKHLRLRLERLLPRSLGDLAQALFDARPRLRQRFPDAAQRRRALDEALREGGALDPLDSGSAGRVAAWLETGAVEDAPRTVSIRLASDDPEDLTLKQARLLGQADVICCDGEVAHAILARARADAVRLTCERSAACGGSGSGPACARASEPNAPQGLTIILRAQR